MALLASSDADCPCTTSLWASALSCSQTGLPSTLVMLEAHWRPGNKPGHHGPTPCFRNELDSLNRFNSEPNVLKSKHTLGFPVIWVLLNVLSCMWRMSFGLVWSGFIFKFAIRIAM